MKIYLDGLEITKKEYCCEENKELFSDWTALDVEKDDEGYHIKYTDWSYEYGNTYHIDFKYCPFCGKKIELIEE